VARAWLKEQSGGGVVAILFVTARGAVFWVLYAGNVKSTVVTCHPCLVPKTDIRLRWCPTVERPHPPKAVATTHDKGGTLCDPEINRGINLCRFHLQQKEV